MAADNLQIRCEYEFAGEAHTDKEIESVVKVMKGTAFRDAYIWVRSVPSKETSVASAGNMTVEPELNANSTSDVETSGVTFIEGDDAEPYEEEGCFEIFIKENILRICSGIQVINRHDSPLLP